MAEEKKTVRHNIIMQERSNLSVTGVVDVISFDEENIVADTEMGVLILKGNALHINKLNLDKGELEIDGEITNLSYEEAGSFTKDKNSLFGKIFR